MRNRNFILDYNKSLSSQIESVLFSISRVKSMTISEKLWKKIQTINSLREHHNPDLDRFMNVPFQVSENQKEDLIIKK